MFIYNLVIIFSFVGFFVHLFQSNKPKSKGRVVELLLLYQLVFNVGILGIISFLGHTLLPIDAARYLKWLPSPFQQELANASLGFGVIGILCIWVRNHFWTATVIGSAVWLFGDAIQHLYDIFFMKNISEVNTGIVFYSDLLIPIFSVILLILNLQWKPFNKPKYA
jgi:hypothetical protein